MARTREKEIGQERASARTSPSAMALEELRQLLLGPEQAQLGKMKERLDALNIGPTEVGEVLSEAIRCQSQKNNDLKDSLTPIIQDEFSETFPGAFKRSVLETPDVISEAVSPILVPTLNKEFQREFPQTFLRAVKENPNALADAISPIIIPGIQKWVRDLVSEKIKEVNGKVEEMVQAIHQSKIGELVENINEVLESQSPIQRLKWRWQAFRTGRSYDDIRMEYLFAHFEVKHVFLIHTKTAALLSRVSAAGEGELRENIMASLVSGIKKMCEDFGKRSEQGSSDQLELFKLTTKKIFVEIGPHALLAVVIKNYPPAQWKEKIRATLSEIHNNFSSQLEEFNGTMEGFEQTAPYLERLVINLQSGHGERISDKKGSTKWLIIVGLIVLIGLGSWIGRGIYNGYTWNKFVSLVKNLDKNEVGLVVTSVEKDTENRVSIKGFRDPTFEISMLEERFKNIGQDATASIDSLDLDFTPFFPLSPEYILQLAHAFLSPPDSVDLLVTEERTLEASGIASTAWLTQFRLRSRYLPGISNIQDEKLQNREELELLQLIRDIENFQLLFPRGKSTISPESNSQVEGISKEILRLDRIAEEVGKRIILAIHGHASEDGSSLVNERISLRRAQRFKKALNLTGLRNIEFQINAMGTQVPIEVVEEGEENDSSINRRISLHIETQEQA